MLRCFRLALLVLPFCVPTVAAQEPAEPLPPRALVRLGTPRFKANGYILKLAFSPDDAHLYATGLGVQKFDARTGRVLDSWPLEYGEMLDLSPIGRWMLVGDNDRYVRVVETETGKITRTLTKYPTALAAFSPDGRSVLVALEDEKTLVLRDFVTGEDRARLDGAEQRLRVIAFSPDGKLIAGSEHCANLWSGTAPILIWDAATGKLKNRIESPNQGMTYSLAFTPDNRRLIVGSQQRVRVYDAVTSRSLYVIGHQARGHVALDPKGTWLITGGDAVLWDLKEGIRKGRLQPPHDVIGAVAVSNDGKTIATASGSVHHHTIDLWDAATGARKTPAVRHRAEINEIAFAPDGKTIATRSLEDGTIHLWDADTGKPRRSLEWGVAPFRNQGDFGFETSRAREQANTFLAGGRRWLLDTGKPLDDVIDTMDRSERLGGAKTDKRTYQAVRVSPDGKYAADLDMRRRVRVWDVPGQRVLFRIEPLGKSMSLGASIRYTFTRDSKTLVVSHQNEVAVRIPTIRLYDIVTSKLRTSYRTDVFDVHDLQSAPDGERLLLSTQNGVELRKVETGEVLHWWPKDPRVESRSTAVAISPDSRLIAFETAQAEVTLWEALTGQAVASWPTASEAVRAIAFSPDGRRLATGSRDTSALVWSVSPAPEGVELLKSKNDDQLWDLLAAEPAKAYAVVFALASDSPRALGMLEKRLTAIPGEETNRIRQWIKDQASTNFKTRDEAARQLRLRGGTVIPHLRAAMKEPQALETRRRLDVILRDLEALAISPDRLREERALQTLEMLGTPQARRFLETLAKGAIGVPRTIMAQAALARLNER